MRIYPPPQGGGYYTPWLWLDGRNRGSSYSQWASYVATQLAVPSDVSLTHVGTTYNPATRNGEVVVECCNSGLDSIDAAVQFVITEDSCYFVGPNGDPWHNHVCRDYVPTQTGTPVTLAAGATDTVTIPYTLDPSWVEEKVKLVLYLQNMTVQPDSSMPCYQGSSAGVLEFTGVEESKLLASRDLRVTVSPNPCTRSAVFRLSGSSLVPSPKSLASLLRVYTPDGRPVFHSTFDIRNSSFRLDLGSMPAGIYLYRVNAGTATAEGKLVVAK